MSGNDHSEPAQDLEIYLSIADAADLLLSEANLHVDASTMARLCRLMDGFGMLATSYSPNEVPSDLLGARWRPLAPVLGSAEEEMQWGVAYHKLSMSGDWHVEAEECDEALLSWDAASLLAAQARGRPSCQEMEELVEGRYLAAEAEQGSAEGDPTYLTTWARIWGGGPDLGARDFALFWFDWIDFLGRASFRGGFEVHS